MDRPNDPTGRERSFGWLLAALLAIAVLAGFEWEHYRRLVRLNTLPHSTWDRVVIVWLLAAKTLSLLAPVLAGNYVLLKLGWRRCAQVSSFAGALLLLTWLALDLRVQQTTGNHLLAYRAFLFDPDSHRWAGNAHGLIAPVLAVAAAVAGGLAALQFVAAWLLRSGHGKTLTGMRGHLGVWSAVAVVIGGIGPAHAGVTCTVAVEQVHAALPWNPFTFALAHARQSELDDFRLAIQHDLEPAFRELCADLAAPAPADERAFAVREPRPHVVVVVLESLRHDLFSAGYMPKTATWAQQGLQCERHFAGTNCSHLGIFGLLYARSPMHYERTVGAIEPQACVSFHRAGYECSFVTSGAVEYERMNDFIRRPTFDRVEVINHQDDWPSDDRVVLRRARQILGSQSPQFLMMFLMSTHFPYRYPPEYERHRPAIAAERMLRTTKADREGVFNRYRNACAFLDDELAEFIGGLDPARHLVVVTGDHGESHFDDGVLTHWGRMSEQQCRTPLVMVGPGVWKQAIATATTHADALPTLLHALSGRPIKLGHSHGRDLLAGSVPDQAWNCTKYPGSSIWEGMLVRGDERLGLKFSPAANWLQVTGLLNIHGRIDDQQVRRGAARLWAETLARTWR